MWARRRACTRCGSTCWSAGEAARCSSTWEAATADRGDGGPGVVADPRCRDGGRARRTCASIPRWRTHGPSEDRAGRVRDGRAELLPPARRQRRRSSPDGWAWRWKCPGSACGTSPSRGRWRPRHAGDRRLAARSWTIRPCPIVVELAGGVEPPLPLVRDALSRGKHVITANKALLSAHGQELFALAAERRRGAEVRSRRVRGHTDHQGTAGEPPGKPDPQHRRRSSTGQRTTSSRA